MKKSKCTNLNNESSLSRVWKQSLDHATGTITAYRSARDLNAGKAYTKAQNQGRSDILAAKLLRKGYGITKVRGRFTESYGSKNAKEVNGEAFLVVDLDDSGRLRADLVELGTLFEQDSITFSEASSGYLLIATNSCPHGYPEGGIGTSKKLGTPLFSKSGEFYSKVNGRPFVFEDVTDPLHSFKSISIRSKQAVAIIAEKEVSTVCRV